MGGRDEIIGNIRFSADLSLNSFGEPSDFVTYVTAEIQQYSDDDFDELVKAGFVSLIIVRLGEAYERYDVKWAFDDSASLFSYYEQIWNDQEDWFVDQLDLDPNGVEVLIIDRAYLAPEFRGLGLGKRALQRILNFFSARCDLVVLKSFPLQFEASYKDGQSNLDLSSFKKAEPASQKALDKYYGSCGFKPLGKNGYMYRFSDPFWGR